MKPTKVYEIFKSLTDAILDGVLIRQVSRTDKEFHFQNWFEERLRSSKILYDTGGRNSYPDFTLVEFTEGYEIKGLAYPGREANYDSNSQIPTGFHNGRDIFYVFGRYPSEANGREEYPVIDLVVCHGDFLNADHAYRHQNKSFRGFGSYGDIMIRDRKMYVAPTPFSLATGLNGTRTLIVPSGWSAPTNLKSVGKLDRFEASDKVIGYSFDLLTNEITPNKTISPSSGKKHSFTAYRIERDTAVGSVTMREKKPSSVEDGEESV